MDQEVKRRWVEALRSGKYEQGSNYLRALSAFCCLGVLCEIAVEDGVIPPAFVPEKLVDCHFPPMGVMSYAHKDSRYLPPPQVAAWAGFPAGEWSCGIQTLGQLRPSSLERLRELFPGDIKAGGGGACALGLPDLNDNGCSFGLIADVIEDCL